MRLAVSQLASVHLAHEDDRASTPCGASTARGRNTARRQRLSQRRLHLLRDREVCRQAQQRLPLHVEVGPPPRQSCQQPASLFDDVRKVYLDPPAGARGGGAEAEAAQIKSRAEGDDHYRRRGMR